MVSENTSLKLKLKHFFKEKLKVHFFFCSFEVQSQVTPKTVVGAVRLFSSSCTISITGLLRAGRNSSFSVIEQIRRISKLKSEWLAGLGGVFFFSYGKVTLRSPVSRGQLLISDLFLRKLAAL